MLFSAAKLQAYRQQFLNKPPISSLQTKKIRTSPTVPPAPSIAERQLQSGLSPYEGAWNAEAVRHLLRRTMFGCPPTLVETVLAMDRATAVNQVLAVLPLPSPPINNYTGLNFGSEEVPEIVNDEYVNLGETWINMSAIDDQPGVAYGRFMSLKAWWLKLMRQQPMNITEKMVLFWHNHLVTQFSDSFSGILSYNYLDILRQHALGNVKSLVRAITLNPQMLLYLNGAFNSSFQPDENYARELQELFCIGKDINPSYSEEDVQAAARVLTGWTINWDTMETYFNAFIHDEQDKHFSSFYNNAVITGKAGLAGQLELDELLDMIFAHPETARFIVRKIYRFFVYHGIDAATETDIIEPLADMLRTNNYEIAPVLNTLFNSEHFFDVANRSAMIKSPMDWLIGLWREFAMSEPEATDYNTQWRIGEASNYFLHELLQEPGDPPNVAGWPAYYQFPQYDKYWITTSSLPGRNRLATYMTSEYFSVNDFFIRIDFLAFTHSLSNPAEPNTLIEDVTTRLCAYPVSNTVKLLLKSILLSGQQNDSYWTTAWNNYINNPNNEQAAEIVNFRLLTLYNYILALEEYQLM